jgi:hypothetical protein
MGVIAAWTSPAWMKSFMVSRSWVEWETIRAAVHMWFCLGSVVCGAMAFNAEKQLGTMDQLLLTPEPREVLLPARALFMFQPFLASALAMLCVDGTFLLRGCPGVAAELFVRYIGMTVLIFAFSLGGVVIGLYLALATRSHLWATVKGAAVGVLWTFLALCVVYAIGSSGDQDEYWPGVVSMFLSIPIAVFALMGLLACAERFDHLLLHEPNALVSVTFSERGSARRRRRPLGMAETRWSR